MAKRRITLTSQEMNEINNRTQTLESQLQRSNTRVEELETGLGFIEKLVNKKSKPKNIDEFRSAVRELVEFTLNPPVAAKIEMQEANLAAANN